MIGPSVSDGYFTHNGRDHYEAPFDMILTSFGFTFRDASGNLANMPSGIQFANDQSVEQQYLLALDGILNGTIDPKNVTISPAQFEDIVVPIGGDVLNFVVKKGQKMCFFQIDTGTSGLKGSIRLQFKKINN